MVTISALTSQASPHPGAMKGRMEGKERARFQAVPGSYLRTENSTSK